MAKETKNAAAASVSLEGYVPSLQKKYKEEIVAKLMKDFGFKSVMQVPVLEKITINQGMGQATQDKKLIEVAQQELTLITGQKAMLTYSRKDISNFKLRKGMPIGVKVTLRGARMYEFLERLIAVSLPRIRDFKGMLKSRSSSLRLTLIKSPKFLVWRLPSLLQLRKTRRLWHFYVSLVCLLKNSTNN